MFLPKKKILMKDRVHIFNELDFLSVISLKIHEKDDVLMFYNAFAPPTGFDIDDNGNAIDTKITTNKLVYGLGNSHHFSKKSQSYVKNVHFSLTLRL